MGFKTLQDGSVLSSNTLINKATSDRSKYVNYGFYKAAILSKIPVGDPRNRNKASVEYDAVILSGNRQGELVSNVMTLDTFGGQDNFQEITYAPKTKVNNGKDNGNRTPPENTNASYVIIGFMNGYYNNPVILGGWRQPNNKITGATDAEDLIIRGAFQKLNWSVNKDGKLTVSHSGTSISLDEDGNISIVTTKDTSIQSNQNVSIESTGNTSVNSTGNVEVTSAAAVQIGGAAGVTFTGPFVKLGENAVEAIILGDSFKTFFDGHTHGGGPPPNVAMPSSTLSPTSKVE